MKISSSNLCLRFYVAEGWTETHMNNIFGDKWRYSAGYGKEDENWYYAPSLDVKENDVNWQLLYELKGGDKVMRAFNDYPYESDEQYMERMILMKYRINNNK